MDEEIWGLIEMLTKCLSRIVRERHERGAGVRSGVPAKLERTCQKKSAVKSTSQKKWFSRELAGRRLNINSATDLKVKFRSQQ